MADDFFGQFGVSPDDVSENPYSITDPNRYACMVSSVEVKEFGKEGAPKIPYLVFEYTVQGGKHAGKTANDMHRLIPWTAQERASQGDHEAMNARLLSGYKKALLSLGIPEAALSVFNPRNSEHTKKLVGVRGTAWFGPQKNNPQYNTVSNFERDDNATGNATAQSANATPNSEPSPTASSSANEVDVDAIANW